MSAAVVDINQQAIADKQIKATVRLKRIAETHNHFNAALQFLTNAKETSAPESITAANQFVQDYFKAASANIVDLTDELAADAFAELAKFEQAKANGQIPATA
jgi:hypothetical protein